MSRILVVDDEAIITMQLEERLTAMGYTVAGMAASGEEAVEKARRIRPDLVLMDIVMPGKMNGIEAAKSITDELEIPIVFVTSYADDNIISSAKSVRPYGYIVKPFNELELKAAIEVALFRRATELQSGSLKRKGTATGIRVVPTAEAESEYLNMPDVQMLLLKDIFSDIILFLYTNPTAKDPIFKFVLEEAGKTVGRTLFSYYRSTLQKYFQKEIRSGALFTYRIRSSEMRNLIPVLEKCTGSLQESPAKIPFRVLLDFSETDEFSEIIAVKNFLYSKKEEGIPVSGILALDIGNLDHQRIASLSGGIQKIIVATGKETMLSFADNTFPEEPMNAVSQSTIDDVVKKLLEPVVLSLLDKPISGYDIVHEIHDRFHVVIPQARVYTILYALEEQGYLEKKISGKSKLYVPTEKGRTFITRRMRDFSHVFQHIIGGSKDKIKTQGPREG